MGEALTIEARHERGYPVVTVAGEIDIATAARLRAARPSSCLGSQMSEQAARTAPASVDFSDRRDFVNADRGFLGALEPMVVKVADGRVVWDTDSWGFTAHRAAGQSLAVIPPGTARQLMRAYWAELPVEVACGILDADKDAAQHQMRAFEAAGYRAERAGTRSR
jgi:hypothetical protein